MGGPVGWQSAPEATLLQERPTGSGSTKVEHLADSSAGCSTSEFWLGRLRPASSGPTSSGRCSLKTEQRTKKPVRAITATGDFLRSPEPSGSDWCLRAPGVEVVRVVIVHHAIPVICLTRMSPKLRIHRGEPLCLGSLTMIDVGTSGWRLKSRRRV